MMRNYACVLLIAVSTLCSSCAGIQSAKNAAAAIPYPVGYDLTSEGASSYENCGDHADSPYFLHPDYFAMKSTDTLTIITGYKTYQQSTEYTCGPAAILTVLNHYGNTDWDELKIAQEAGTNSDVGTTPIQVADFFTRLGWTVRSSVTEGVNEGGATFTEYDDFKAWVISSLKSDEPILVDWLDWGGHWQAVIGYDTMGTEEGADDVLILADPYDTSDQWQDGYYTFPAERFYWMWREGDPENPDKAEQPWVIAVPSK